MNSIFLEILDLTQNGKREIVKYTMGEGNFITWKVKLAETRKIENINEALIKSVEGQVILNESDLYNGQLLLFDCPNPIYKIPEKKFDLQAQQQIVNISLQISTKCINSKLQICNKICNVFVRKSNQVLEQENQIQFKSKISEELRIDDSDQQNKIMSFKKLLSQVHSRQLDNNNQPKEIQNLFNSYLQQKQQNEKEIQELDMLIYQQFEQLKQAENYNTQEILRKLKELEKEKQQKTRVIKQDEANYYIQRESMIRFAFFNKKKLIKSELDNILSNPKMMADPTFRQQLEQFRNKINKLDSKSVKELNLLKKGDQTYDT